MRSNRIYRYLLFSHQKGDQRCIYISHPKENIKFNIEVLDRTFISGVIPHPNCYFPSLLSQVQRKSEALTMLSFVAKHAGRGWGTKELQRETQDEVEYPYLLLKYSSRCLSALKQNRAQPRLLYLFSS